jgi:DNA-binding NtrC family response regulator
MKHTVLFVDDEPQILNALNAVFKRKYTVLTALGGPAALEILKTTPVHVIVSDQRMPEMLGVELLRIVKDAYPATTRILLTGYSDLDAIIASINSGDVFRYINKPWQNDKLRETVEAGCLISEKMLQFQNPASATAQQPLATAAPAVPKGVLFSDTSVLFVDTNAAHLEAMRELFKGQYATYSASNIEAAFDVLLSNKIGVLVTETSVGTSDIDGADFLAAVKDKYPDIVTILLSDSKDAALAIRLINEGRVFRYLIKPFQREMIRQTISQAFDQHRQYLMNPIINPKRIESSLDTTPSAPVTPKDQTLYEYLTRVRERLKDRQTY